MHAKNVHRDFILSLSLSIFPPCTGDWVEGKKEGRGEENSQLGLHYRGQWKADQKWGPGEEKTLVGTTFTGTNILPVLLFILLPISNC